MVQISHKVKCDCNCIDLVSVTAMGRCLWFVIVCHLLIAIVLKRANQQIAAVLEQNLIKSQMKAFTQCSPLPRALEDIE